MKYIDLHADTILPILQQGEDASLYENSNTHDIKRLQKDKLLHSASQYGYRMSFDLIDVDSRFNPSNPEDLEYIVGRKSLESRNQNIQKTSLGPKIQQTFVRMTKMGKSQPF